MLNKGSESIGLVTNFSVSLISLVLSCNSKIILGIVLSKIHSNETVLFFL